jgi:hypothetical protein
MTNQNAAELQQLVACLRPLAEALRAIPLDDATAARAALERALPMTDPRVVQAREAAFAGAAQGWLLPRAQGEVQFGRVAKDLCGFSVDAVRMSGPGLRHRHPRGEIDLLWTVEGTPSFDGHAPGWAVYGPGSAHVPAVSGGTMLILYFLPGGAIEWLGA